MRRTFVLFTVLASLLCTLPAALASESVAYSKSFIRGVPVHIITVNLNARNIVVTPAIARHGIGTAEGFGSMLSRLKPCAAITGTYFCVKSLIPVGDIVVSGKRLNSGDIRTVACFNPQSGVAFRPVRELRKSHTETYPFALASGPRLVTYGVPGVYPHDEGFRDSHLYMKARRSALGVTKQNKLLLVTVDRPIYLSKLAWIMRELGAYHAINLDGGSSTALHYKGRSICHPGRSMTNLVVVYDSASQFASAKSELAPSCNESSTAKPHS